MIDPAQLSQVALFSGMKSEHLSTLVKSLRPLHIEGGQELVSEGVTTRGPLMIVTKGMLEVTRKDPKGVAQTLAMLEPPTVIGELEFLADVKSSATVTAHDDVEGYLLPRQRFEALFDEGEAAAYHLALAIGRIVSKRLADTNVLLAKALSKDSKRMVKVQKAQFSNNMNELDAELQALLDDHE